MKASKHCQVAWGWVFVSPVWHCFCVWIRCLAPIVKNRHEDFRKTVQRFLCGGELWRPTWPNTCLFQVKMHSMTNQRPGKPFSEWLIPIVEKVCSKNNKKTDRFQWCGSGCLDHHFQDTRRSMHPNGPPQVQMNGLTAHKHLQAGTPGPMKLKLKLKLKLTLKGGMCVHYIVQHSLCSLPRPSRPYFKGCPPPGGIKYNRHSSTMMPPQKVMREQEDPFNWLYWHTASMILDMLMNGLSLPVMSNRKTFRMANEGFAPVLHHPLQTTNRKKQLCTSCTNKGERIHDKSCVYEYCIATTWVSKNAPGLNHWKTHNSNCTLRGILSTVSDSLYP